MNVDINRILERTKQVIGDLQISNVILQTQNEELIMRIRELEELEKVNKKEEDKKVPQVQEVPRKSAK